MNVAIIITVFNRIDKTLRCLESLFGSIQGYENVFVRVFLTDDGSTDRTSEILRTKYSEHEVVILQGNGHLFWNGGMNNSWVYAVEHGAWDGFLWLNNDSIVYPNLWKEILDADQYAKSSFKQSGIYIGSTYNQERNNLSYGGFNFTNKITLKDRFVYPDGTFQSCQCAHGNITFVSANVVHSQGVLCDGYQHGGGDHDYTYLAYKKGFPLIVLREFVGECENDHPKKLGSDFFSLSLSERLKYLRSPLGYNLNNSLLFQKRCFPYRYPFVFISGYFRALFPFFYYQIYKLLRR